MALHQEPTHHPWHMARDEQKCASTQGMLHSKDNKREGVHAKVPPKYRSHITHLTIKDQQPIAAVSRVQHKSGVTAVRLRN